MHDYPNSTTDHYHDHNYRITLQRSQNNHDSLKRSLRESLGQRFMSRHSSKIQIRQLDSRTPSSLLAVSIPEALLLVRPRGLALRAARYQYISRPKRNSIQSPRYSQNGPVYVFLVGLGLRFHFCRVEALLVKDGSPSKVLGVLSL